MVHAAGKAAEARRPLSAAMLQLVKMLEAKGLKVARHKTKFMAGDEETARNPRLTFAEEGILLERVSGATDLDCDADDGARRRTG